MRSFPVRVRFGDELTVNSPSAFLELFGGVLVWFLGCFVVVVGVWLSMSLCWFKWFRMENVRKLIHLFMSRLTFPEDTRLLHNLLRLTVLTGIPTESSMTYVPSMGLPRYSKENSLRMWLPHAAAKALLHPSHRSFADSTLVTGSSFVALFLQQACVIKQCQDCARSKTAQGSKSPLGRSIFKAGNPGSCPGTRLENCFVLLCLSVGGSGVLMQSFLVE